MERKVALYLVVVHTGTCQLEIIWNLIQENSEDNYEFLSSEKRVLNTHALDIIVLRWENASVFASLWI